MSQIEAIDILIVDDEGWFTEPIVERLENMGYSVEQKTTVTAGLKAFIDAAEDQRAYQVLIADLMLPYGDELEVLKEEEEDIPGLYMLKKVRQRDPKIPVFCYTVIDDQEIIDRINKEYKASHFAKATREDQYLFEEIGDILGIRN